MTLEKLSPACRHESLRRPNRPCLFIAGLLLLSALNARAAGVPGVTSGSSQSLAFARHIALLENGDAFEGAEPVAVSIEASLPGLYKEAALVAVRDHDENGRPKYHVLAVGGDGTVLTEVIGRYFGVEQQMDDIPASSVAVTPANYKFRFAGEVSTGGTPAYIYRITPKRGRRGLLSGHVWIDSRSGAELMVTGHLTTLSSMHGSVAVVRETKLRNGSPSARVSHVVFTVPNLGRSEVIVTEYLLRQQDGGAAAEGALSASMR
ncbi:MAG: hypothetical protein C5B51_30980 [Terriglobia bacterium]|nr:MAG: hypothetical protein C5B51_30980 [Terriglobia bacterium]